MKSFRLFCATAAIFCGVVQTNAQVTITEHSGPHYNCGLNHFQEKAFQHNPGLKAEAKALEAGFIEFMRDFDSSVARDGDPLIIPVVFHIIHFNGNENISDAQVHSAIEVANEDYSASTPGIATVDAAFAGIVGDVNFEFRLAKKDPNGNCTNGIIRTLDAGTSQGGENLKSISIAWPRSQYLNVWVCASIESGAAGYAYLPWGVPSPSSDGIVLRHDYVGRIGTSNNLRKSAFTHEIGHWSSLLHTWGEGNTPGTESNCNQDDGVEDTPNTRGNDNCPSNPITCGTLDNIENFMDYSYCYKMFTEGQADRMASAMNSFTAERNSLWTESNLIATGVLEPDVICVADFEAQSEPTICSGQSITFQDYSFNGVETRSWVFEGGEPSTSAELSPAVTYNNAGTFAVTLTVSNANGSETVVKSDYVTVFASGENQLPYMEGFEAFSSLEPNDQNWSVINEDDDNVKWELMTSTGYQSAKSVRVRGRNNFSGLDRELLISPTYDLSGLTVNAALQFRYAHARRSSNSDDRLRILISKDCGASWSLRKTINIDDLPTVPENVTSEFIPTLPSQWQTVLVDNISSIFLTDEFRVQFEFESYLGNNIYIDNINIIDGLTVGQREIEMLTDFNVFPNPTAGETTISFTLLKSSDMNVDLLDLTGRRVKAIFSGTRPAGSNMEYFDTSSLAQGMYVVRIVADGQQITRRISVM